jgi:hypothetical protein
MPCWFVLVPLFLLLQRYCYVMQPTCCKRSQLMSNQTDHRVMAARVTSHISTAVSPGTVKDFYNGVVKQGSSIVSSWNGEAASQHAFNNLNYSYVPVSCRSHRVQNSADSLGTESWHPARYFCALWNNNIIKKKKEIPSREANNR